MASGDLTLPAPTSGNYLGALFIAIIGYAGAADFTGLPTDWAVVHHETSGNTAESASAIRSLLVAYWICDVELPSSDFVFTRTGGSDAIGNILVWQGHQNPPFGDIQAVTSGSASTNITLTGGLTTETDDARILVAMAGYFGSGSTISSTDPAPGDWIGPSSSTVDISIFTRMGYFRATKATAGATGNIVISTDTSARHSLIAIEIKSLPSVAVGPGVVDAKGASVDPTTIKGSIVIEPNAVAKGAVVAPTVVQGSLIATGIVEAKGDVVPPAVGASSTSVAPAPVSAVGDVVAPLVKGELIIVPAEVEAKGDVSVELVDVNYGPLFSPDISTLNTWTEDSESESSLFSSASPTLNVWTPEAPLS